MSDCSQDLLSVPEKKFLPVRWTIFDYAGLEAAPSTARYRVDCLATGIECVPWTDLTPDSPMSFVIPASANVIRNNVNTKERKRLTVEANAGLQNGMTETADYVVVNNRFIA